MTQTKFLRLGALLAALAVVLGAFGAHALKDMLTDTNLTTFETGVRYQFYHSVALLVTGILLPTFPVKNLVRSGWCFVAGIVLFSVSLYVLSLRDVMGMPGLKFVGAITPLGGLCFIAGWLLMALAVSKKP